MAANPFLEFRDRYASNAALFVEEVLGMDGRDEFHTIDPEQRQILDWVSAGERRISVRSGHGVGKTCALAWVIVWHNVCRFPQRVVATAPTGGQLFGALAKETNIWLKKLPPALYDLFDVKSESFVLKADPDDSNTEFRTSRAETPEALAGVHAETGWVLLIADEASGVPDAVFEAASGSMSARNATTILAGNPVRLTGLFHDTHTKLGSHWKTLSISCEGHRRVSPDFIEDMARRYGRDSNAYRVRVLGEFPKSDDDAIIPRDLMEAALYRDVKAVPVKPIWGCDPGGGGKGGDPTALAKRQGNVLVEPVIQWVLADPMESAGRIKQEWDRTLISDRPSEILIDSIGVGAGMATRLRELGLPARSINVSETPAMREQYLNLKAELWVEHCQMWFRARDCNLAGDKDLGEELCAHNHGQPSSSGRAKVEEKKHTRKRLGRSPNRADAFVLTFASESVSVLMGAVGSTAWNEPLKRGICLV